MDVHPTKNVSIGIDPYPGSQNSPRLNCFFAQPRIAGPSLSWRSRRRLERLFTWRPSNPRAPPSRMMFKKKTARKVACKSHTQKKQKNIYIWLLRQNPTGHLWEWFIPLMCCRKWGSILLTNPQYATLVMTLAGFHMTKLTMSWTLPKKIVKLWVSVKMAIGVLLSWENDVLVHGLPLFRATVLGLYQSSLNKFEFREWGTAHTAPISVIRLFPTPKYIQHIVKYTKWPAKSPRSETSYPPVIKPAIHVCHETQGEYDGYRLDIPWISIIHKW